MFNQTEIKVSIEMDAFVCKGWGHVVYDYRRGDPSEILHVIQRPRHILKCEFSGHWCLCFFSFSNLVFDRLDHFLRGFQFEGFVDLFSRSSLLSFLRMQGHMTHTKSRKFPLSSSMGGADYHFEDRSVTHVFNYFQTGYQFLGQLHHPKSQLMKNRWR